MGWQMKSGKIWGDTFALLKRSTCEVHYIEALPGFRCSRHRHIVRANAFYVIEGELTIVVEKSRYKLTDVTTLAAGELMEVPAGEWHWFETRSGRVRALEIYYPEPGADDIERSDAGSAIGAAVEKANLHRL